MTTNNAPPPQAPPATGHFRWVTTTNGDNLEPQGEVPHDQEVISRGYYAIRNTLMLLKSVETKDSFDEFEARNREAAQVGCVGVGPGLVVNTRMAESAQSDIRDDVVRRKGKAIVYRYLLKLALIALAGVAVGCLVCLVGMRAKPLSGYGAIIIGSMVGAWLSMASTRQDVAFDGIKDFADRWREPFVRILFVGLIATAFAVFLDAGLLPLKVGDLDFKTFHDRPILALALGIICGISERAISVKVIERARKVISP